MSLGCHASFKMQLFELSVVPSADQLEVPPPTGCDNNARFSFSPAVPPQACPLFISPRWSPGFCPWSLFLSYSSWVASLTTLCACTYQCHLGSCIPSDGHCLPSLVLPSLPSSIHPHVLTEYLVHVRPWARLARGFDDDHKGGSLCLNEICIPVGKSENKPA